MTLVSSYFILPLYIEPSFVVFVTSFLILTSENAQYIQQALCKLSEDAWGKNLERVKYSQELL